MHHAIARCQFPLASGSHQVEPRRPRSKGNRLVWLSSDPGASLRPTPQPTAEGLRNENALERATPRDLSRKGWQRSRLGQVVFHAAIANEPWFGGERDDVRNIANTAAHHPARIPPLTSDSSMAVVNAVRLIAFESAEADFSIAVGRIRHRLRGRRWFFEGANDWPSTSSTCTERSLGPSPNLPPECDRGRSPPTGKGA